MAWQRNGTPDTLNSATNVLSISDLTPLKINQFISHYTPTGGTFDNDDLYFNGDNASLVNAYRSSTNGGADNPVINQDGVTTSIGNAAWEYFHIVYMISIPGEEKLGILFSCVGNGVGSGSAPGRNETVYKFVPSPDANVTQVAIVEKGTGNMDINSNLSALGTG